MKISIASYSFHGLLAEGKMDLFGYLEACRFRYHVQAADIWNGMFASTEDDFLKKMKEGLEERQMELANLCVDGPHIWEDDPAVREQHYQDCSHLSARAPITSTQKRSASMRAAKAMSSPMSSST